jgi:UrcA family protein
MNTLTCVAVSANQKTKTISQVLALVALAALAGPALAAGTVDEAASIARSARISLAGLDLSTPTGVGAAKERLRKTAQNLCFEIEDRQDLARDQHYVQCVNQTVARTWQQLIARLQGAAQIPVARASEPMGH